MVKILIGVMGPGESATDHETATAYALGQAIAQQGWGGGRAVGVMAAASAGAQASNGLVVGILPDADATQMSAAVDVAIFTGMGQGRNVINVLSSQVVIACGVGPGTLAEMALALKLRKPLILLNVQPEVADVLSTLSATPIAIASTVADAIARTRTCLSP